MATSTRDLSIKIGKKTLLSASLLLLILMITAGVLTWVIPSGKYQRIETNGIETLVPESFTFTDIPGVPVWRWFTAPAELLWGPDGVTVASIIVFMLLIAGAVNVMNASGLLSFLILKIINRYKEKKYLLLKIIVFVFMIFGSGLGTMEESILFVPIICSLAVSLGWDITVGLGMSMGAMALGFASAISNPFTVGIAQKTAGLPMFSGAPADCRLLRCLYCIYPLYAQIRPKKRNQDR